jgi:DNA-binding beta-propeller fold protein YncE
MTFLFPQQTRMRKDSSVPIARFPSKCSIALLSLAFVSTIASAQVMVVGLDRKFAYDENAIRQALEPGKDEVLFYDLKDPANPRLMGSVQLENSILGPPTNVAVTPDQSLALIANAVHSEKTESGWKAIPADELFVVDLKASPPKLVQTLKVGRQPSGIAISKDGKLALVANRDSKSITTLMIDGSNVTVGDTVSTQDSVSAVAISPDRRHAVATKKAVHKAVLLEIGEDGKLNVGKDLWVGLFPWNVAFSPDGRRALVNNIGNNGQSDGNAKTVSVIDMTARAPFVVDQIAVGDGPEGVAFSPNGKYAAITILQGSYDAPTNAWFRRETGAVSLLSVASDKIRVVSTLDVGAFPEGIAIAPDNLHVYVGNFHSQTISVLKIDAATGRLTDTKQTINLPGPPASLRIGSQ